MEIAKSLAFIIIIIIIMIYCYYDLLLLMQVVIEGVRTNLHLPSTANFVWSFIKAFLWPTISILDSSLGVKFTPPPSKSFCFRSFENFFRFLKGVG